MFKNKKHCSYVLYIARSNLRVFIVKHCGKNRKNFKGVNLVKNCKVTKVKFLGITLLINWPPEGNIFIHKLDACDSSVTLKMVIYVILQF